MESKCPDETLRKRVMNVNLCFLCMLEDIHLFGAAFISLEKDHYSIGWQRIPDKTVYKHFPVHRRIVQYSIIL